MDIDGRFEAKRPPRHASVSSFQQAHLLYYLVYIYDMSEMASARRVILASGFVTSGLVAVTKVAILGVPTITSLSFVNPLICSRDILAVSAYREHPTSQLEQVAGWVGKGEIKKATLLKDELTLNHSIILYMSSNPKKVDSPSRCRSISSMWNLEYLIEIRGVKRVSKLRVFLDDTCI